MTTAGLLGQLSECALDQNREENRNDKNADSDKIQNSRIHCLTSFGDMFAPLTIIS